MSTDEAKKLSALALDLQDAGEHERSEALILLVKRARWPWLDDSSEGDVTSRVHDSAVTEYLLRQAAAA